MRELEFLPAWYPCVLRKRSFMIVQSWLTLGVVGALGLWVATAQHAATVAEASLAQTQVQMDHTRGDLDRLDQLLTKRRQWQQKEQVLRQLGMHIEATKLMDKLSAIMPKEMAILSLEYSVESRELPGQPALARAAAAGKNNGQAPRSRQLNVEIQAVVPTDVDLANFLARLSGVTYFRNVSMKYARDRSEGGHMMREFDVSFSVNLNGPAIE